jgi:serine/threonine protein kinase/ribosomal protein L37AE/L43A
MPTVQDRLLGRIALAYGMVTQEQLNLCLNLQAKGQANRPLGELLLEKKFISPEQRTRLLALQKKHVNASATGKRETGGEGVFGQRLLQRKLVTPEQLNECLRFQECELGRGQPKNLGQILVEKGYLSREQVKEVLAEQQRVIVVCNSCGARFNATAGAKLPKCPSCGGQLATPPWSASLPVLDTIHANGETEGLIGKRLGGVKIQSFAGRSSKGILYKASLPDRDRIVAVKVIADSPDNKLIISQFLQASKAIASVRHPNLLRVYQVGTDGPYHYVVTDFIHGRSLNVFPERNSRVPPADLLYYAQAIARGLAAAHARRILHRDLTPDNVLLSVGREVFVKDFGFARPVEVQGEGMERAVCYGTPAFMAPELWDGKPADVRTDLYALGVTLYLLLAGRRPFDGLHLQETIQQHLQASPPPIQNADPLAAGLEMVIGKLLAKKSEHRYQTAAELEQDLARVRAGQSTRAAAEPKPATSLICQVCGSAMPPTAEKCPQCKSGLFEGDMSSGLPRKDRSLVTGEFECANCGTILQQGVNRCSHCGADICSHCKQQVAVVKGLCGECLSAFSSQVFMPAVKEPQKPPSGSKMPTPPRRLPPGRNFRRRFRR